MSNIQTSFYNCSAIHLYVDQGLGCARIGGSTGQLGHTIQCGCPCSLVAKNNKGQIKKFKYSGINDIHIAIATIRGNGFNTDSSGKSIVNIHFYKI